MLLDREVVNPRHARPCIYGGYFLQGSVVSCVAQDERSGRDVSGWHAQIGAEIDLVVRGDADAAAARGVNLNHLAVEKRRPANALDAAPFHAPVGGDGFNAEGLAEEALAQLVSDVFGVVHGPDRILTRR